jgi:chaperone modulatory protein CbpM
MQAEPGDTIWLDGSEQVSFDELIELSGSTEFELRELVDIGALTPRNPHEIPWRFGADCVISVRKAIRLKVDLELDTHALAVALDLLARIHALESELSQLRAQYSIRES